MRRCTPALLVVLMFPVSVLAQGQGDLLLQLGAFHIRPQESSEPLQTDLRPSPAFPALGIEESFESPGTGARVSNSETLALILKYFVTDDIALKLEGGIPVKFDIYGQGIVKPTGVAGEAINVDLGAAENNPIGSARQWSPVVMAQYHFGEPDSTIRPYIGLGATYTWFTDVELNDNLKDSINSNFGTTLATVHGKPGPTSTSADAESDWAPVFNLGAGYRLSEHWGVSASVSYLMLSTTASITIEAADGTRLSKSETDLDLNPVVFALLLNYRF